MKNETIKNEKANQQKAIFQNSFKSSQQKLPTLNNAGWLSLVNDRTAWEQPQHVTDTRHYYQNIDPREFRGIAPPFSWE